MQTRNETTQAPVLQGNQMGRAEIESILQNNYKIEMGGFWRWLFHQRELDCQKPPEDLDPCIKLMEHLSRNHNDIPTQDCEICAVWMIVWSCWQAAENHGSICLELMRDLELHLQATMDTYNMHLTKMRTLLRAVERLHPQQEVRQSEGNTVHIYTLYKRIKPQFAETPTDKNTVQFSDAEIGLQNLIRTLEKRAVVSIHRLYRYIKEIIGAVECLLESPGNVYVDPQNKDFLLSMVAYNLKEAGFKPIAITDMLNGEEPLTWDSVGNRRVLSAESALKRDRIVKRIQRFSENVKRGNQDADNSY